MPHRGYRLQPRVAASATLGTNKKRNFNRNAVASFSQSEMHKADATALGLRTRRQPWAGRHSPLGQTINKKEAAVSDYLLQGALR